MVAISIVMYFLTLPGATQRITVKTFPEVCAIYLKNPNTQVQQMVEFMTERHGVKTKVMSITPDCSGFK